MNRFLVINLSFGLLLGLLSGCNSKKKISASVSLEMKLAQASQLSLQESDPRDLNLLDVDPDTIDFTSNVNNPDRIPVEALARSLVPESLLYEIASISSMEALTGFAGAVAYACPSTEASKCLVDLADPVAVKALLASNVFEIKKEVDSDKGSGTPVGTIAAFSLNQCLPGETTSIAKFKGKATFMGRTWYTTSSSKVLTTNEADYDYITLSSQSCVGVKWILPNPVTLLAGETTKVSLFVNLTDLLKLRFYSNDNGMGGCAYGTLRSACLDDAKAVPYVGEANPIVEIYEISTTDSNLPDSLKSSALAGTMILFVDSVSNEPIGGTIRSKYDGSRLGWTHGPSDLGAIVKNSDGTYTISNWESDGQSAPTLTTLTKNFQRTTHSGVFQTRNYGGSGTMDWPYSATLVP